MLNGFKYPFSIKRERGIDTPMINDMPATEFISWLVNNNKKKEIEELASGQLTNLIELLSLSENNTLLQRQLKEN